MAPYSSTLAWKIPWTEKPGRLVAHGVAQSRTRLKQISSSNGFLGPTFSRCESTVFIWGQAEKSVFSLLNHFLNHYHHLDNKNEPLKI